jgi:hypothetical protein
MINEKSKNTLIEFLIYSILFTLSLSLFPICNFYYLGDNETMLTKPQYFFDFGVSYVFPLFFLMVILAFLSLKKALVITINIIVIIFTLLTFLFIQLGFAWWGASPFHPDFQAGYWLSQLLILIVIIRTFTLIKRFPEFNLNRKTTIMFSILSISIPLLFIGYLFLAYNNAKNEPIMRSEWEHIERNRLIKDESWDYTEAYDAYVSKYYSMDTLRKEKFQLDSARFTFFDDKSNIVKRFTQRASSGILDVEEILDEND